MDLVLIATLGLLLFGAGVGPIVHDAVVRGELSRVPVRQEALCQMYGCPLAWGHTGSHVSAWPGL